MSISESAALRVVDALSALVRTARSYTHVRHEQLGATGVALAVLKRLALAPARSGDLACALGVSASAVSRAVAAVEQRGYVCRTTDPSDARASVLEVTPAGRLELDKQHRAHAQVVRTVLDTWDDAKAATVLEGMAELEAALAGAVAQMRSGGIPHQLTPRLSPATPSTTDPTTTEKAPA